MNSILQVFFYSVISGLILSLAIPNELFLLGNPLLSFVAIIPFYLAIKKCKNFKTAFWCGFIQTITTHLISSYWLAFFKDFAIFTLGGSALATAIIGGYFSTLAFLPFSLTNKSLLLENKTCKKIYQTTTFKIFYFVAIYVFYEYVKSSGFLGYPWGTVSSTMYKFPLLMQIASITGTYGITFLTVFTNVIFVEIASFIIKNKEYPSHIKQHHFYELKYTTLFFVSIFCISLIYGSIEYYKPRTPQKSLRSLLVQPNINSWTNIDDKANIFKLQEMTKNEYFSDENIFNKPQLIVWSEGALLHPFPAWLKTYEDYPSQAPLIPFIKELNIPLLTGGTFTDVIEKDDGSLYTNHYNSTLLFSENGELKGNYAKIHLVPFAEYIPGLDNPFIYKVLKSIADFSDGWARGTKLVYFDLIGSSLLSKENVLVQNVDVSSKTLNENEVRVRISTPICFDDAFTDTMRPLFLHGSEAFFNVSDDSWSHTRSSEYQHFVIASYRAIEYRTTLVRTTNAGYTVVLDPAGKILADLPLFEEHTLTYDVPIYERKMTCYAFWGNWLPVLCIIFFIFTCALIIKQKNSQE